MVRFNDWCSLADTPVGNHHLRAMTGRPAASAVGIQATASAVPNHYAAEERVARVLAVSVGTVACLDQNSRHTPNAP
jgi:hypothetical protein